MTIEINTRAHVDMRRIGRDGHPLLVIDDFLLNPETIVDFAADASFGPPRVPAYPGVNTGLPQDYLPTVFHALRSSFARGFGLAPETPVHVTGFLALATRPLEQLLPRQRIPHYDFVVPGNLAVLHYLGQAPGGGTGFFRHDATGFELIDAGLRETYNEQVDRELAGAGDRLNNFTGPDTPNYTMLDQVEAKFNRLIVYRSACLHCALFDGARLSDDPRSGRLTANTFVLMK